jgi:hypothetical protein
MSRIEVAYGICRAVKLIDHPAIWAIRTSVTEGGDRLRYSPGIRVCQRQSRPFFDAFESWLANSYVALIF